MNTPRVVESKFSSSDSSVTGMLDGQLPTGDLSSAVSNFESGWSQRRASMTKNLTGVTTGATGIDQGFAQADQQLAKALTTKSAETSKGTAK